MTKKEKEKSLAIKLRKQGSTYGEILKQVPVAKSTLSLWLRDVGLSSQQSQKLTNKKRESQKKGANRRREQRIKTTEKIHKEATKEIGKISKRDLYITGIALYWAEGAKEKEWSPGSGIQFGNSDPQMISVFLAWLYEFGGVEKDDISVNLYIHKVSRSKLNEVRGFWEDLIGKEISYIYIKQHKPKTVRKNIADSYRGLVSIRVKASSGLTRKLSGLANEIGEQTCRMVQW